VTVGFRWSAADDEWLQAFIAHVSKVSGGWTITTSNLVIRAIDEFAKKQGFRPRPGAETDPSKKGGT